MKLISCYIENFGRLSQFAMDFTEGLNIVQAENGWGKSTLSAFLKAMFFGLEYSPKKKLPGNERRRYAPWQGGNYGGNVIFSHKDKTYKIERFFGQKDKDDTFRLFDMASGLASEDFTENIGEEIFEVDRDSFAMSVYFPQNQLPVSMSDSLNAKINDLDAFGGDIDRYEAAMELLETRLKEYKKTGNRGLLGEWEERIARLSKKAEEGQQKEAVFEERQQQLALLQEKIKEGEDMLATLYRQKTAAEEEKTRQVSNQHLTHLEEQVAKDQARLKPLRDFFKGGIPSDEDIEQLIHLEEKKAKLQSYPSQALLEQAVQQLKKDTELLEQIRKEAGEKLPDEHTFMSIKELADSVKAYERRVQKKLAAYTTVRKEQQASQNSHTSSRSSAVYVAGGVLAVCFLLFAIFSALLRIPAIALFAVTVLLLAGYHLGLIGRFGRGEPSDLDDEAEQLQEELARLQDGMETQKEKLTDALLAYGLAPEEDAGQCFERLQILYTRFTQQKAAVVSSQARVDKLKKGEQEFKIYQTRELALAQKEKLSFSEKYGMNLSFWNLRTLLEVKERKHEYEALLAEYKEHEQQLLDFRKEHAVPDSEISDKKLTDAPATPAERAEILASIDALKRTQEQRIRTRESYRRDLELLTTQIEEAEDDRQECERLKETYEEGRKKAELLQKTMKYLKEAKERFSTRYMDKMREGFDRYMCKIDPEAAKSLHLDASLRVRQEAQGSLHEDSYLSTGLLEFAGICTRLALVEAMYEGEKPFLILDDPFVNLDEEKVKKGMELLHSLADTYQILYFTCHSSRA